MNFVRTLVRRWKITVPVAGVVLAGLAWLAFGYFGIHTAFIDNEVDEAVPVFDAAPAPAEPAAVDPAASDATMSDDDAESVDETATSGSDAPAADDADVTEPQPAADSEAAEPATPAPAPEAVEEPAENVVMTTFSGEFGGLGRYDVSGDAVVLGNGTDQRFLRFENFESDNGPDLNVYLINPDDPSDFVDLGDLSGNIGNQNYEIPADVDLDRYSQVGIWCVRFSVGFGTADLMPTA